MHQLYVTLNKCPPAFCGFEPDQFHQDTGREKLSKRSVEDFGICPINNPFILRSKTLENTQPMPQILK